METQIRIESGDRRLLDVVAEAMEEAQRRGGAWIACRLGCTECCLGPFEITQLDAWRLRRGLEALARADAARARCVRRRAAEYVEAAGDRRDADGLPEGMDDAACPALDPVTGSCDLYAARPVMCRAFGPVTRAGGDLLGACALCYAGASDQQMAACAVEIDPAGLEAELLQALEAEGRRGTTTVAEALAGGRGEVS